MPVAVPDMRRGFFPDAGDMMSHVVRARHGSDPAPMRMLAMRTDSIKSESPREAVAANQRAACGFLHLYIVQAVFPRSEAI